MSALDAIYARQSIDKADSLSIQGQIDLCKKQTAEDVKVYEDKGYSGKNTNRPAFQRMMEDVEKGLIRKIVVYRLDRFSRSIADFGRLWETLKKHGVEFVSINETFDTSTPMGRAMLNIIMVFAQLERETTAERVRDNYYQRVKLGVWPGGPAPFGFSVGRTGEGSGLPTLVANERAAIVERIFRDYAQDDASLGTVARSLNAEGIPAPKRATWDNVTLSRILHNPAYVMADEEVCLYYASKGMRISNAPEDFDGLHAGMVIGKRDRSAGKYQDLKDQHFSLANHFGIIPADVWLRCQYKLDQNRQIRGAGRGKHTWLSGLLKCACCGYSVKVNRDGEKYYLICSGRSNLGACEETIRVDLRGLESCIAEELEKLLAQCPDVAAQETQGQEYARELEEIDRKINRLVDALSQSDAISVGYINSAIRRLDEQRRELLEQFAKQKNNIRPEILRLKFEPLDFEQKKLVAAQFIKEIRLSGDTADVIWNV